MKSTGRARCRLSCVFLLLAPLLFTNVSLAQECEELLQNNDFSSLDWEPWEVDFVAPSATLDSEISDDARRTFDHFILDVEEEGATLTVSQGGLSLEAGTHYRLSFSLSTSVATELWIRVHEPGDPEMTLGLLETETSSSAASTFVFGFVASETTTDAEFSLEFELEDIALYLKLDNLFLAPIGCGDEEEPGDPSGMGGSSNGDPDVIDDEDPGDDPSDSEDPSNPDEDESPDEDDESPSNDDEDSDDDPSDDDSGSEPDDDDDDAMGSDAMGLGGGGASDELCCSSNNDSGGCQFDRSPPSPTPFKGPLFVLAASLLVALRRRSTSGRPRS